MSYYAIDSCHSVGDGSETVQLRQWTCTFQVAYPLLRCCAASRPPQRHQGAAPDFTASSLLQQCFLEPPAVVRLQVRSLMTVRQHEDAEEPGETSSTGGNVTPPNILASGQMLYWRCADGDGLRLRDSGSCGRVGTLMGDTSWSEPLPADEPLDAADEWGTAIAPSCMVNLSTGGKLAYIPDSGMHKSLDQNMLNLVDGDRTGEDELRCLEEVQQRGPGDEDSYNTRWTVEFWARLTSRARGLLLFFSCSSVDFTLKYSTDMSTFSLGADRVILSNPVRVPMDDWFNVLLRSDLNGDTVLEISQSSRAPVDTGQTFGPVLGLNHRGDGLGCFSYKRTVGRAPEAIAVHAREGRRVDRCSPLDAYPASEHCHIGVSWCGQFCWTHPVALLPWRRRQATESWQTPRPRIRPKFSSEILLIMLWIIVVFSHTGSQSC